MNYSLLEELIIEKNKIELLKKELNKKDSIRYEDAASLRDRYNAVVNKIIEEVQKAIKNNGMK